jgi:FAD/FMN-containing dehydrogenase
MTIDASEQIPLDGLDREFAGELLRPGERGFEEARRIWNGAIDRRPGLIARCARVADVAAAVRFARERDLLVAVRGGGHGVSGHAVCDGGVVIDLSAMRGVHVDPRAQTARADGGALNSDLDEATQAFGLATTAGIVSHTGIAGLTLGGGIGWLMRRHGTTVDNLRAADVVTADGELVHASEDENADLFWGLRGAGSNFGVVTSFEYQLHTVGPTVLAGPVYYPIEETAAVLRRYREVIADAPDELTTILNLRLAPPLALLPRELHGRPVATVIACCSAALAEAAEVVRPLRKLGTVLFDGLAPKPYVELQRMFDPGVPHGWHYYWKTRELPPLSDGAIDILAEHCSQPPTPQSYVIIFQLGGAVSHVDENTTAYSQRDAAHNLNINAVWLPDDEGEPAVRWARELYTQLEPFARDRAYINFLDGAEPERIRAAYGERKYGRLTELKQRYDPTNFFRLNHNITPFAEQDQPGARPVTQAESTGQPG